MAETLIDKVTRFFGSVLFLEVSIVLHDLFKPVGFHLFADM
jgi:hypothetical protein